MPTTDQHFERTDPAVRIVDEQILEMARPFESVVEEPKQTLLHHRRTAVAARLIAALSIVTASACVAAAPPVLPTTTAPAPADRPLPNDVRWFRNSAEYRALALEVYSAASQRLPALSGGLAAGSWAVIFDVDETLLDNSEYQRRRAVLDSGYTAATWAAWVAERAAVAVPGAVDFTRFVHALGGRVVIVTNRLPGECDATRANLASVGVESDMVLCQPEGESNKNPRFERVQHGTAERGVPALKVVAWVGDNIQDFPGLTQATRNDPKALAEFGSVYFILPNPMYGSWQQVP
jgi:5'-nucleotidase (lipoprotein e(P4) family)